MGWTNSFRNHGGMIFIDVRDRYGITQLTFDSSVNQAAYDIAYTVRSEYVISVEGVVRERPEGLVNTKNLTGGIEVVCDSIEILSSPTHCRYNLTSMVQKLVRR